MARRKQKKQDETLVDIVEVRDSAQDYFEQNQLKVLGALGIIVVIIGGLFAYNSLYKGPRNDRAMDEMFQAQFQFERDSFALALDNPGGGYDGFLDIIDNYRGTKAANLAQYYAGVSYLHLGRYDAAVDYLESFNPKGQLAPVMKYGALGDAYSETGDMAKAESMYKKAASTNENEYLTSYYLRKLGLLYEHQGNYAEALKQYNEIKEKYPNSAAGRDIDKFVARVSNK